MVFVLNTHIFIFSKYLIGIIQTSALLKFSIIFFSMYDHRDESNS